MLPLLAAVSSGWTIPLSIKNSSTIISTSGCCRKRSLLINNIVLFRIKYSCPAQELKFASDPTVDHTVKSDALLWPHRGLRCPAMATPWNQMPCYGHTVESDALLWPHRGIRYPAMATPWNQMPCYGHSGNLMLRHGPQRRITRFSIKSLPHH